MNLFLRETSQSPVNHRLKHVLKCILPALKAAEIAKFMALLDSGASDDRRDELQSNFLPQILLFTFLRHLFCSVFLSDIDEN